MTLCLWDATCFGSLISTKPSDNHVAPGWSSGELSVLSTPPTTVVSCTTYILPKGGVATGQCGCP